MTCLVGTTSVPARDAVPDLYDGMRLMRLGFFFTSDADDRAALRTCADGTRRPR